jgi:hypothetical protein
LLHGPPAAIDVHDGGFSQMLAQEFQACRRRSIRRRGIAFAVREHRVHALAANRRELIQMPRQRRVHMGQQGKLRGQGVAFEVLAGVEHHEAREVHPR